MLLYDTLFKLIPLGLNVPLYLVIFYAALLLTLGKHITSNPKSTLVHLALIALLCIPFVLLSNPLLLTINAFLILLLLCEQVMLCMKKTLYDRYSIHFVGDSLTTPGADTLSYYIDALDPAYFETQIIDRQHYDYDMRPSFTYVGKDNEQILLYKEDKALWLAWNLNHLLRDIHVSEKRRSTVIRSSQKTAKRSMKLFQVETLRINNGNKKTCTA